MTVLNAQRYAVPFTTAFDTYGVVSPGAKLYFYLTTSSTPANTYSDAGLTTANSNPVVANGAGLFGSIFLTPGQQYKVVLEDANSDIIWTADPVYQLDVPTGIQVQDNSYTFAIGAGTAQAITATFTPAITALVDGMELCVRALHANTGAAPTFAPNGLTAYPITKLGGFALLANDIFGALHELRLRYNLANTRWELINPSGFGRNAYSSFNKSSPSTTGSATSVQMGLGSSWALTPVSTGRVRITASGYVAGDTATANIGVDATYGTGTAPVNGAAKTGTYFNSNDILSTVPASGTPAIPITLVSEASGLTVGTAYWFDMTLAVSSGNASISINSVVIEEL